MKGHSNKVSFTTVRRLLAVGSWSCAALGALPMSSMRAQEKPASNAGKVEVIHSYHNDISPPLRDTAPRSGQMMQQHEAAENASIVTEHEDEPDRVVQQSTLPYRVRPRMPAPILSFAGIAFPGVGFNGAPPDPNGAVGQTQYVQMVNEGYQVFDKATGVSLLGPASIVSVWAGFGGVCENNGMGDPIVLYDQLANRWVISQNAGTPTPTDECVAVSTTSDATSTWYRYGFHLGPNQYTYPKLSLWPDAYYMSTITLNLPGTVFLGPEAFAMDRSNMLVGNAATIIVMPVVGNTFPHMLPADLDGSTLPPAGAPNPFVMWPDNGTYRVYHFHVDFMNPGNSSFTLFASPVAAAFTQLCPNMPACVPELGQASADWLDGMGDRLMFRLAYRNFGGCESLIGNYSVSASSVAGVRWFELRNVIIGPPVVYQESTYQPDTTWRWMGSIAMDQSGNMALGYSASSASIFPEIRYTGRLATDAINTMPQGEMTLHAGTGAQIGSGNHWGDYSDMTVDPVDDCTFWYTQEYYDTTSSYNWRTRIGNFKFGTCGGGSPPPSPPNLVSAASRLTNGVAQTFDINMPLTGLTGTAAVEDRSATTYYAVFTFSAPVTAGVVTATSAPGYGGAVTVGVPVFSGNSIVVPLTGVSNAQDILFHIASVNGCSLFWDEKFGFLCGDTTNNRMVNSADIGQTNSQSGNAVTGFNFREDVNLDGAINSADLSLVQSKSGTSL